MSNPIKDKFIEHMQFFGLTKETQRGYISGVRCLAKHYNMSPEHLSDDQVRKYFRYLLLTKKLACGRHARPVSPVSPISTAISAVGKSMTASVCSRVRGAGNCGPCCPWKKSAGCSNYILLKTK